MYNIADLDRSVIRYTTIWFSFLLVLSVSYTTLASSDMKTTNVITEKPAAIVEKKLVSVEKKKPAVVVVIETTEVVKVETNNPMTAIEIIINKRIHDTVLEDDRPPHVYRPRTPIFHKNHPENVSVPPEIKRHLLVDHPEINNNQGRKIRTPPSTSDTQKQTNN